MSIDIGGAFFLFLPVFFLPRKVTSI